VLTEAADIAKTSNAPYGANLDAALDSVPRTVFGVDYIPDTGLIVTMSPWVLLVTVLAAVIGGVIVARRRVRRLDEPAVRAQFLAARERERIAERERDAAAKVTAKAATEDTDR